MMISTYAYTSTENHELFSEYHLGRKAFRSTN
jgi:hypothetical protein